MKTARFRIFVILFLLAGQITAQQPGDTTGIGQLTDSLLYERQMSTGLFLLKCRMVRQSLLDEFNKHVTKSKAITQADSCQCPENEMTRTVYSRITASRTLRLMADFDSLVRAKFSYHPPDDSIFWSQTVYSLTPSIRKFIETRSDNSEASYRVKASEFIKESYRAIEEEMRSKYPGQKEKSQEDALVIAGHREERKNNDDRIVSLEVKLAATEHDLWLFCWSLSFLAILLLGIGIYLWGKIHAVQNNRNTEMNAYYEDIMKKVETNIKIIENDFRVSQKNDLLEMKNTIQEQLRELKNKAPEVSSLPETSFTSIQKVPPQYQTEVEHEPVCLYFGNPDPGGYFPAHWGQQDLVPSASIYVFELSQDGQSACFSVIENEAAMQLATVNLNASLAPVCEIEYSVMRGIKRIITVKKGLARKEGDCWIIDKHNRAKIKVE